MFTPSDCGERSKTIVEPRASTQWFCTMKPMADVALAAVERGEIRIVPDNRREEYFNWMRNIRDWTLSRQLWWGHRIPAWYCGKCGAVIVSREDPTKCVKCGSRELQQDPDVLDTWFSSGLWPFSTLGWPEKTADIERYYPTTLLITGYDILFSGGADDHAGVAFYQPSSLSRCVSAFAGAYRERGENVQVERHRTRPGGAK